MQNRQNCRHTKTHKQLSYTFCGVAREDAPESVVRGPQSGFGGTAALGVGMKTLDNWGTEAELLGTEVLAVVLGPGSCVTGA